MIPLFPYRLLPIRDKRTTLVAIAGLLFWLTLASCSPGESSDTESQADTTHAQTITELPPTRFNDSTLAYLNTAFDAYEQIRALLAQDTLDGIASHTRTMDEALSAAVAHVGASSTLLRHALSHAREAAQSLGSTTNIKEARQHFGETSRYLVALASADSRLTEGRYIFQCPMVTGFQKWFQQSPQLENPYMGQHMLQCGGKSIWRAPVVQTQQQDGVAYYTCPMHPSVKQQEPGQCPICGMDLTPVTTQEVTSGTILVDDIRRQRIGVRTAPVEHRAMTMNIRAVGKVQYDETRLADVNLRMSGWVKQLIVSQTGQYVRNGQTLFSLYSPELYAAQREYLATAQRHRENASETFANLLHVSRRRLALLGMSDAQIHDLEHRGNALEYVPILAPASGYVLEKNVVEGARVEAGTRVYRIANLDRIWIDADVYESDLPHIRTGQQVRIELPYLPNRAFTGRVDYIYPTIQNETRTGRIRVVLANANLELKPDMYANVSFDINLGHRLAIPDPAVLYTGPRRLVFIDLGEGRLQPTEVQLGMHANGYYEVISGVKEGDVVVTSGNFLIAAESRIRSATTYWGGDIEDTRRTEPGHHGGHVHETK